MITDHEEALMCYIKTIPGGHPHHLLLSNLIGGNKEYLTHSKFHFVLNSIL